MRRSRRRVVVGLLVGAVVGAGLAAAPQASADTTSVVASADTYVNQSVPTTNQGTATTLAVYGTPTVQSYVRFAVPAVPAGQAVASAKLRLTTTTLATAGTADTLQVKAAANTWSEASTLYANRPALGATLGSLVAPNAANTPYEVVLDPAAVQAAGGGDLSLAVVGSGSDSFWFVSREASASANRPTLVVDFAPTGPADTTAPSVPTGLTAGAASNTVSLTWDASTDDTAVTGYHVHRSSTSGFTPSPATLVSTTATPSFAESRPAGTWYYRVTAFDAAGNVSAASDEASVTVTANPPGPPVSVVASADTFVNQAAPTTNQGTSTTLAVYGTPTVQTYLRFAVPAAPSGQAVATATLRIRTTTSATAGSADTQLVKTADNGWSEASTLYANRPALGATVGEFASANGANTSYDVALDPAAVQASNGADLSLAITGGGADSFWVNSREATTTANRPTLVVQFASTGPADTTKPSSPSSLAADATASTVALTWNASTDDTAVTGYQVHRSSNAGFTPSAATLVATVPAPGYSESRPVGTWYYRVTASDAAGNVSDPSAEASATVESDPVGPPIAVAATADTYVNQSAPTTNQGTSSTLAVYGTPSVQSYLRFPVPAAPAGQTVASARLRITTTGLTTAGTADTLQVRTAANTWSEASTLYANRPSLGSSIGSLEAPNGVSTAYEVTLDPAAVQSVNGADLSLAVVGSGADSFWFSSRETSTAANRPTLVVQFTTAPVGSTATVMAAGDIACPPGEATTPTTCRHAEVASMIQANNPDRFIAIGDTEQGVARLVDYYRPGGYNDTFGAFKSITLPVLGNHDMLDPSGPAQGYFDYFYGPGINSGPFGTRGDGYYSSTIGAWRFIALNSECQSDSANGNQTSLTGGCGVGSPQYVWLQNQLATAPACTLVAYHRPRWTTGLSHPPEVGMAAMWDLMSAAGVDVVLNGHVHSTEIFKPIGASGTTTTTPVLDQNGIKEFVAGIGGDSLRTFGGPSGAMFNALEARDNTTFGALKLTLRPTSFDWVMTPIPGQSFTNVGTTGVFTGTSSCH